MSNVFNICLLIVDDEPESIIHGINLFEKERYKVKLSETGQDALNIFKKRAKSL